MTGLFSNIISCRSKYAVCIALIIAAFCSLIVLTACNPDEPDTTSTDGSGSLVNPGNKKVKTTILIYAIASNNLYGNLIDDKNEILSIAGQLDIKNNTLLIYQSVPDGSPTLLKLENSKGQYVFNEIKKYDADIRSTDPERMKQVLADARSFAPAEKNGLIFWSHGSGWSFSGNKRIAPQGDTINQVIMRPVGWFGQDKTDGVSEYMDITDLASAIIDSYYDFIWFDACYMSSIETIYQLRGKCDYFVGYPMEIASEGMPYHITMPFLLKETPNLIAAASEVADYFIAMDEPVAIAIVDMEKTDEIAEACKFIYQNGTTPQQTYKLFRYSRQPFGPFFDLRQLFAAYVDNDPEKCSLLDYSLSDAIIYKNASESGYNGMKVPDDYCAISSHFFNPQTDTETNLFYKSLDWTLYVYEPPVNE